MNDGDIVDMESVTELEEKQDDVDLAMIEVGECGRRRAWVWGFHLNLILYRVIRLAMLISVDKISTIQ